MTLSFEKFKQLRNEGLSVDQINRFESGEKPKQITTQKESGYQKFSRGLGEISTGVAKGGLSTLQGLGQLTLRGAEAITGKEKGALGSQETFFQDKTKLEAKTPLEKVGKFGEQVAEFAIPGGAITKAGKVAGAVTGASKLGKLGGLGIKAGTEAIGFGGISATQTGELGKEARDTAIISALFPVAGAVSTAVKNSKITETISKRLINSLIKPSLRVESYGKNPGLRVAQEGLTASSFEDLSKKISERRGSIFGEMETIANKSGKTVDLSDVIIPIDKALEKAMKTPKTNSTLITRLQETKDDLLGILKNTKTPTVKEAVDFKRTIGDITKFTGNASDDSLINKPLKMIYGKTKDAINQVEPKLKGLNERYADLTSAEIATRHRDIIAGRQNILGLTTQGFGTGAALISAIATGGAITPAILIGVGAAGVKEALSTPRAKTQMASFLVKLSKTEKEALFKKAPWLKGVLLEFNLSIGE